IRALGRGRHEPFIGERNRYLLPIELGLRKRFEEELGRRAAGDGKKARAAHGDRVSQEGGNICGQSACQLLTCWKFVPLDVHRYTLSCQVRPSRSINAIEPDGPQVPAV